MAKRKLGPAGVLAKALKIALNGDRDSEGERAYKAAGLDDVVDMESALASQPRLFDAMATGFGVKLVGAEGGLAQVRVVADSRCVDALTDVESNFISHALDAEQRAACLFVLIMSPAQRMHPAFLHRLSRVYALSGGSTRYFCDFVFVDGEDCRVNSDWEAIVDGLIAPGSSFTVRRRALMAARAGWSK